MDSIMQFSAQPSPNPQPAPIEIDHCIPSEFSSALAHLMAWRIQASALNAAADHQDPAISQAYGEIFELTARLGDNLRDVALERGESIGDYY
jgi:hypothetical protein